MGEITSDDHQIVFANYFYLLKKNYILKGLDFFLFQCKDVTFAFKFIICTPAAELNSAFTHRIG